MAHPFCCCCRSCLCPKFLEHAYARCLLLPRLCVSRFIDPVRVGSLLDPSSYSLCSLVTARKDRPSREKKLELQENPHEDLDSRVVTATGERKAVDTLRTRDWLVGEVAGKDCIIVDDIIDSGTLASKVSKLLRKAGARRIYMYSTHGLFSRGAIDRIDSSAISEVLVTNTIPTPQNFASEKIRILSVGKLLAEVRGSSNSNLCVVICI